MPCLTPLQAVSMSRSVPWTSTPCVAYFHFHFHFFFFSFLLLLLSSICVLCSFFLFETVLPPRSTIGTLGTVIWKTALPRSTPPTLLILPVPVLFCEFNKQAVARVYKDDDCTGQSVLLTVQDFAGGNSDGAWDACVLLCRNRSASKTAGTCN